MSVEERRHGRDNANVDEVLANLVAEGMLEPLAMGGDDEQRWFDCDLASLAENNLGDATDPSSLDDRRRRDWLARATADEPWQPSRRSHEHCCWLLDRGVRVGTIALSRNPSGRFVQVTSLYVFLARRGHGVARTRLEALRDALGHRNLGVRLETHWTWQRAVRFYLQIGMWVRSWKRDLAFWWDSVTPRPRVDVSGTRATLSIQRDQPGSRLAAPGRSNETLVLATATHLEDRLELDVSEPPSELGHLRLDAMSTIGLELAVRGWPLIRSRDHWEQARASDLGPPESLAYRISLWEAWSRKHGWRVDTPRIPGLDYPTWDELGRE